MICCWAWLTESLNCVTAQRGTHTYSFFPAVWGRKDGGRSLRFRRWTRVEMTRPTRLPGQDRNSSQVQLDSFGAWHGQNTRTHTLTKTHNTGRVLGSCPRSLSTLEIHMVHLNPLTLPDTFFFFCGTQPACLNDWDCLHLFLVTAAVTQGSSLCAKRSQLFLLLLSVSDCFLSDCLLMSTFKSDPSQIPAFTPAYNWNSVHV